MLFAACKCCGEDCIFISTETVGGASVSSGCWGEDSNYGLAGAVHSHVASPALNLKVQSFNCFEPFYFV